MTHTNASAPRRRRLVAFGAFLTVMTLLPSCALGDKQKQADRIDRARNLATQNKTARGTMRLSLIALARPPVSTSIPGEKVARPPILTATAPVGFDFAHERTFINPMTQSVIAAPAQLGGAGTAAPSGGATASLVPVPPPAAPPAAPVDDPGDGSAVATVFQDGVIFVRRTNLRATERRGWAKLDYTGLPSDEPAPDPEELSGPTGLVAAAHTLNPTFMLDLARGVLAGSVKVLKSEPIGGVPTTHYRANISRDQALSKLKLSDEDRATRNLMFKLLGARGDVTPAEFWVDGAGLLRRVRFVLIQRYRRTLSNLLVVTIDIPDYGVAVPMPSPSKEETLQLERYGALVRAVTPHATS